MGMAPPPEGRKDRQMTSQNSSRNPASDMVDRRLMALDRFINCVARIGFDGDVARRIAGYYLRHRIIRFDGIDYKVRHGAFMDRDVLENAAKACGV